MPHFGAIEVLDRDFEPPLQLVAIHRRELFRRKLALQVLPQPIGQRSERAIAAAGDAGRLRGGRGIEQLVDLALHVRQSGVGLHLHARLCSTNSPRISSRWRFFRSSALSSTRTGARPGGQAFAIHARVAAAILVRKMRTGLPIRDIGFRVLHRPRPLSRAPIA